MEIKKNKSQETYNLLAKTIDFNKSFLFIV